MDWQEATMWIHTGLYEHQSTTGRQSVNESVSDSVSQCVNLSVKQSVSQEICVLFCDSMNPSPSQGVN